MAIEGRAARIRAHRRRGVATVSTAVALGIASAATAAAEPAEPEHRKPPSPRTCEVRTLPMPEEAVLGRVGDIERVKGLGTVYYGSYQLPEENEEGERVQRAVVWIGLHSDAIPVGPTSGTFRDTAFELTASGLINGQSVMADTGEVQAWVQSLRTGRLRWVDSAPGGEVPDDLTFRRINDRGAGVGTAWDADGTFQPLLWKRPWREAVRLPGDFPFGSAWDINNRGEVVGEVAVPAPGEGLWMASPTLWRRNGDIVPLAKPAPLNDAYPRLLNDARDIAGLGVWGEGDAAHLEAAFWPELDEIVGLGLLPGGGESITFGLDEGGWLVGYADVYDPENPAAEDWGSVSYGWLWTGMRDLGHLRVLPSPYAVEHGLHDWREWYAGSPHGVNRALNQVGTYAHGSWLPDGSVRYVPTVYLNADRCGELVETTHVPFWVDDAQSIGTALAGPRVSATETSDRVALED